MLQFTLQQLEYAVALAREGSFVKAAAACQVTQPTLSMQIQKLEQALGLTLFDRSRQPVVVTEEGTALIQQAQTVVYEALRLAEMLQEQRHGVAGTFRLGIIPTVAPALMPVLAPRVQAQYPGVQLQVTDLYTHQVLEALQREEIDAGIIAEPPPVNWLAGTRLGFEPFLVYMGGEVPLVEGLDLDQLTDYNLWLLGEGHCLGDQVRSLCRRIDNSPHLQYLAGSLDTLVRMADAQGGVTVLPQGYTHLMPAERRSRLVPLHDASHSQVPGRELWIIYRREALRAHIRKALQRLLVDWVSGLTQLSA